jgi:ASC-1-like (ASCH) protein
LLTYNRLQVEVYRAKELAKAQKARAEEAIEAVAAEEEAIEERLTQLEKLSGDLNAERASAASERSRLAKALEDVRVMRERAVSER